MWAIGINQSSAILFATPVSLGGYGMSLQSTGYLYFSPVIAVVIGEVLGHYINDVSDMFLEPCFTFPYKLRY